MTAEISQEELARRLDVSFASVNAWERARTEPRAVHRKKLDEMAEELGIRQGLSVVVIDDEPDVCELAEVMIRTVDPTAIVTTATSGTDGLLACGALQPDLVLLDLRMPGLDGVKVARAMEEGRQQVEAAFPLTPGIIDELIDLVDAEDTQRIGDLQVDPEGAA